MNQKLQEEIEDPRNRTVTRNRQGEWEITRKYGNLTVFDHRGQVVRSVEYTTPEDDDWDGD